MCDIHYKAEAKLAEYTESGPQTILIAWLANVFKLHRFLYFENYMSYEYLISL